MLSGIKQSLSKNILNIPGWQTVRKIVVIESDDWGSVRMPSREVYNLLLSKNIPVDKCPYNKFDSLASEKDLCALFEILTRYKDENDNHPKITANTVVANPDFVRIEKSNFNEYYYELFTDTLKRYPNHSDSFKIWKQGMHERVFYPQFHGREHVNIEKWLMLLRDNNPYFHLAFKSRMWGLGPAIIPSNNRINIQAAFDTENRDYIDKHKLIIEDGLRLFKQIFNFESKSFIANNFIWHTDLSKVLFENGVKIIQGMKYQLLPYLGSNKHKALRHYTGEIKSDQVYLVRNCIFEPSQYPGVDSVNMCISQISNAFFWRKPAIINSHRLNFIGHIDEANRNNNIRNFDILIKKIITKWPDVEFMTSVELGELIIRQNHTNDSV